MVASVLALAGRPSPGTSFELVDVDVGDGVRVRGEWVQGPGVHAGNDAVVLYVHGSGYAVCSARTHRGLVSRLSKMTGLPVFACDYRLAPRHRFPAPADDVRAAFDWLLERAYSPDRIVLAGDSAGGHLILDLVLELRRSLQPTPAALALFSPFVDLTLTLADRRDAVIRDPMISAAAARRLVGLYTRGLDPEDRRLALEFDDVTGFPPTLIQAGGAEMLRADAEYLADVLGARCRLEVWPDQAHVFQALPLLVREADLALGEAAAFIVASLAAGERSPHRQEIS